MSTQSRAPRWMVERSSGYLGHRCQTCAAWVYDGQPLECRCTAKPSPMSTQTAPNAQTPGPLHDTLAVLYGPKGEGVGAAYHLPNQSANARLLAASYTAFDRAGRQLGIDAAELAERLDLVALIRATERAAEILERDEIAPGLSPQTVGAVARGLRAALSPLSTLTAEPKARP